MYIQAIFFLRLVGYIKMPAVVVGPPQRSEQMWQALKIHITKERQRKKQGNILFKICFITFIYNN
jgi:hypothetical protein